MPRDNGHLSRGAAAPGPARIPTRRFYFGPRRSVARISEATRRAAYPRPRGPGARAPSRRAEDGRRLREARRRSVPRSWPDRPVTARIVVAHAFPRTLAGDGDRYARVGAA